MLRSFLPLVLAVSSAVACCLVDNPAWGQKRGSNYKYLLTDLKGFNDQGYQSQGQFLTNRTGDGTIMILGNSRRYPAARGPAVFHPALWNISAEGTFPATEPVDLELPEWSAEAIPTGFNQWGMSVGRTNIANTKDANGNWIFPAYVDVPGRPYQELPGVYNHSAEANALNDDGDIVGTAVLVAPNSPTGTVEGGALWPLNADGTVGQPIYLGRFIPQDINNSAVMAGTIDNYPAVGCLVDGTLVVQRMPVALRYLAARISALNDYPFGDSRLAVVGSSWRNDRGVTGASDSERGFVWRPFNNEKPTTVLGTLGGVTSQALDVNRAEQVVGWATDKRGSSKAVVYVNGTPTNLNTATDVGDRVLQQALGINEVGDIVGFMQVPRPASEQHGFLLRLVQ